LGPRWILQSRCKQKLQSADYTQKFANKLLRRCMLRVSCSAQWKLLQLDVSFGALRKSRRFSRWSLPIRGHQPFERRQCREIKPTVTPRWAKMPLERAHDMLC
jgi:hypothetical protein